LFSFVIIAVVAVSIAVAAAALSCLLIVDCCRPQPLLLPPPLRPADEWTEMGALLGFWLVGVL
jgi:hypothetical protein